MFKIRAVVLPFLGMMGALQISDLVTLLLPGAVDGGVLMEVHALSALVLGFAFVGSGNTTITSMISQTVMEREGKALDESGDSSWHWGLQNASDAMFETLKAIRLPISFCHQERPGDAQIAAVVQRAPRKEKAEMAGGKCGTKDEEEKPHNTFQQGYEQCTFALQHESGMSSQNWGNWMSGMWKTT
ncbi:hypothetical protein BDR03DRAFT_979713 [Suillus americanus]|nr:hypothetical protein BDR03DRAFT_979713 [Suillus americanus]